MNSTTKKQILPLIGMALSFLAISFAFGCSSAQSFDKELLKVSKELNKTCPYAVDKDTRLDNTLAIEKTLQYNYTLVNMTVDSMNVDNIKAYVEKNAINNIKTNPDMKLYRDNNVTLAYSYKDKNGVFLFKIDVTPDKYK